MDWSIEDVEQKLLLGKIDAVALPPATVVGAVNRVESMLGSEWKREPVLLFSDLTFGILGLGTIGRSLSDKLYQLGAKRILGWNRTLHITSN